MKLSSCKANGIIIVNYKFYYGPGGDTIRGGLGLRFEKLTLQGNARNTMLDTDKAAVRYREVQFYHAHQKHGFPEKPEAPETVKKKIDAFELASAEFFELVQNDKTGLGKLMGYLMAQTTSWMVSIMNSSSRATQRGIREDQGDRDGLYRLRDSVEGRCV